MRSRAYLDMRHLLAGRAIDTIRQRLLASAALVIGLAGPLVIALLAFIALPALYAASCPLSRMTLILLGHAIVLATPVWLLRKLLLPGRLLAWQAAMPLPRGERLRADVSVALRMMCPWFMLHSASLAFCLWQAPLWLVHLRGRAILCVAITLLLATGLATAVLHMRRAIRPSVRAGKRLSGTRAKIILSALVLRPILPHHRIWLVAHCLFQILLSAAWLLPQAYPATHVPPALVAFFVGASGIALSARLDALLVEHLARLAPIARAWPVSSRSLQWQGKLLALTPVVALSLGAIAVPYVMAGATLSTGMIGIHAMASCAANAFVCLCTRPGSRGRIGAAVSCAALLGVIGSAGGSHVAGV